LNAEYQRIQQRIHRGIPRLNRDAITQVMKFTTAVLGPILKSIGNTKKSNMKVG